MTIYCMNAIVLNELDHIKQLLANRLDSPFDVSTLNNIIESFKNRLRNNEVSNDDEVILMQTLINISLKSIKQKRPKMITPHSINCLYNLLHSLSTED